MMRLSIVSLLCLYMLSTFAYAELPTKTLAQGGWFAIGGPIFSSPFSTVSTYCNGLPCTDENFANAFGHVFTGLIPEPGMAHYYESRRKAEDALINGEFSIRMGQFCHFGGDTGQPAILISGYARYYTLRDFLYTQLAQMTPVPNAEMRVMDFTNAIFTELNNQNLSSLAPASSGPLIDQDHGFPFDSFNAPIAFTILDIQRYQTIANWASNLGAVVNAFNVFYLQTRTFICP